MGRKNSGGDDGGDKAPVPEFVAYDSHPYLGMYPESSEEDLAAVQASVEQSGVRQAIILWKGPGKKIYIIDGRTRQKAAARAFAEAVAAGLPPEAKNGVSLQPDVHFFDGTDAEVYEFIKTANTRKNYTQGQKAVIVVRRYYHEFKERHGETLPAPEVEVTMEGGKTAEELCREAGCNHHFIRIAKQLYRDAPDLLDAVGMNATTPKDAKKTLDARQAGEGGDPDGDPEPPGDPERVLDAGKKEVPERLREAFRSRNASRVVFRKLAEFEKGLQGIMDSPGGAHFDSPAVLKKLRALKRDVMNSIPHLVCKSCKGRGENFGRSCNRCNVTGFVCKSILKAEASSKAKAERDAKEEVAAE